MEVRYTAEGSLALPLLFVPPSLGSVLELHDFIASAWYEMCGKLGEGHLLAGTHVQEIRKWKTATNYMEKYVARPERFPEEVETGRVWGYGAKIYCLCSGKR